jgi:heme exporter protein C
MSQRKGFVPLLAVTAGVFAYLIFYVFTQVPTAQPEAGGLAQKIFYFHVPSAYAMYLCGLLCMGASAAYLVKQTDARNAWAQAGAECAVIFGLMVLTSGPLWARKAWGVYWTWDPRLTTSLLSVLIYVALVVMRSFAGDGAAERKFAAALGVLGTVNLPIIHYSVQKWGGNHPTVITGKGGGLADPSMKLALTVGFIAMTLLAVTLLWLRSSTLKSRARLAELEDQALELGLIKDAA